jgi:CRP/FNR family transcriptional regulator, cyclic AMP receptor protein
MLAPDQRRSQTLFCVEDASILEMSYDQIKQLYYQNPTFGFYFLKLSTARLFDNIERLERTLAERDSEIK